MPRMTVLLKITYPDRVLLYGGKPKYHLIADPRDKVEIGDVVEYEYYGANFGLFKRIVASKKK